MNGRFPAAGSPLRLGCMDSPRRLAPSRRLGGTYFPVLLWAACTGSSSGGRRSRVRLHPGTDKGQAAQDAGSSGPKPRQTPSIKGHVSGWSLRGPVDIKVMSRKSGRPQLRARETLSFLTHGNMAGTAPRSHTLLASDRCTAHQVTGVELSRHASTGLWPHMWQTDPPHSSPQQSQLTRLKHVWCRHTGLESTGLLAPTRGGRHRPRSEHPPAPLALTQTRAPATASRCCC